MNKSDNKIINKESSKKSNKENQLFFRTKASYTEEIEEKVDFVSQNNSRLAAGIIFILVGVLDLLFLGAGMGLDVLAVSGTGTAFILGGFSWFYFIGLPPLLLGVGMVIYYTASTWHGRIGKSANNFIFHEQRPNTNIVTEIAIKDIEAIQFRNNKLGPKKLWILIMLPSAITILRWGLPLFGQPRAETETLPTMMLLSAILILISMLVLVLIPQNYLEIVSKDKIYDFWFTPKTIDNDTIIVINNILNIDESSISVKPNQVKTPMISLKMLLGIYLVIIGLISVSFEVLFGSYFALIGIAYGAILIIDSIVKDVNKEGKLIWDNESGKIIYVNKCDKFYHQIGFSAIKSVKNEQRLQKLDFLDVGLTVVLVIMGLIPLLLSWIDLRYISTGVILDCVFQTILLLGFIGLIVVYWIFPTGTLVIQGETFEFTSILSGLVQNEETEVKRTNKISDKFAEMLKNQEFKKGLIIRAVILGLSVILALIVTLIMI